jgi:alpha-glucosidase
VELVTGRATVLEFRRGPLTVVCNCGSRPVRLPAGEVVVASGPLDGRGLLPPDTAVWLA